VSTKTRAAIGDSVKANAVDDEPAVAVGMDTVPPPPPPPLQAARTAMIEIVTNAHASECLANRKTSPKKATASKLSALTALQP
jgi:hypothetical protein